jgi:hypothetical protein
MTKSEWAYARHREKAGMYALVDRILGLVLSIAREEHEEWLAFEKFERGDARDGLGAREGEGGRRAGDVILEKE